jgi:hypothetical protein
MTGAVGDGPRLDGQAASDMNAMSANGRMDTG